MRGASGPLFCWARRRVVTPGALVVSFEQLRHCLSRVQRTPALKQQVQ